MLNEQQQAAKTFCLDGRGHLNLIARAGTGKTTVLVDIANSVPGKVFMGAFNRSIADELKSRITDPRRVTANTLHGAGLGAFRRQFRNGNVVVDGDKVRNMVKMRETTNGPVGWALDHKVATAADMLVGYAKQTGLGLGNMPYEDIDTWEEIIEHYDVEDDLPTTMRRNLFLEHCIWTYEQSLAWCVGKGTVDGVPVLDFNDMLLAPLYYKTPLPQYAWVLIDEAQDTSECRRRLAIGMAGSFGRVVAVGDDKQAIYGFAGASADAMQIIKYELKSTELPLNVTYRCPKRVVELAQTWVPDFTAHESAPDGEVRTVHHTDFWSEKFNPYKDVILCRYTRPLAGIAVTLRDRGVPCVVEGQNVKSLLALANKWGDIPVGEFIPLLDEYEERKANEWVIGKDRPDKAAAVRDRCSTVRVFAKRCGGDATTKDLAQQLEMAFREQARSGVLRLCTVHRSKGREWDRVYLVGRNEYMPSKWATQRWQIDQEENLIYVAVTRAKRELVEIVVPQTEPGQGRPERDWWDLDD
jgi:DNA helicase II / ATP-dependent DNA helicase PcrA